MLDDACMDAWMDGPMHGWTPLKILARPSCREDCLGVGEELNDKVGKANKEVKK